MGAVGTATGAGEIAQFVKGRMERNSTTTFHQGQSLEIVARTGTSMTAIWRLHDHLIIRPDGATTECLSGYGFYEDEFIKVDGE